MLDSVHLALRDGELTAVAPRNTIDDAFIQNLTCAISAADALPYTAQSGLYLGSQRLRNGKAGKRGTK